MDAMIKKQGLHKLILALGAFGFVWVAEYIGYFVAALIGFDTTLGYLGFSAGAAILLMWVLGGKNYLKLDVKAIFGSFKFMWWMVLIDAVLMLWELGEYLAEGASFQPGWLSRCGYAAVMCLFIGLSEEGMFRGLLFGGFLARFGENKKQLMWSVFLSSLLFGYAHVMFEDFGSFDTLMAIQAALKVLQTGMYGVMLCTAMLKTKNILGPALVHGASDWMLFIVSSCFFDQGFETDYVSETQDEAIYTIIFYLIICALYLPTFIKSVIALLKMDESQRGPFMERLPMVDALQAPGYVVGMPAPGYGVYGQAPWQQAQWGTAQPYALPQQQGQQAVQSQAAQLQVTQPQVTQPQVAQPQSQQTTQWPVQQQVEQWAAQQQAAQQIEQQRQAQWQAAQLAYQQQLEQQRLAEQRAAQQRYEQQRAYQQWLEQQRVLQQAEMIRQQQLAQQAEQAQARQQQAAQQAAQQWAYQQQIQQPAQQPPVQQQPPAQQQTPQPPTA